MHGADRADYSDAHRGRSHTHDDEYREAAGHIPGSCTEIG